VRVLPFEEDDEDVPPGTRSPEAMAMNSWVESANVYLELDFARLDGPEDGDSAHASDVRRE
jgi:hypothetical protein